MTRYDGKKILLKSSVPSLYLSKDSIDQTKIEEAESETKIDKIIPETDEEKVRYDAALRRRQLSLVLAGKMKADDATELKALFS